MMMTMMMKLWYDTMPKMMHIAYQLQYAAPCVIGMPTTYILLHNLHSITDLLICSACHYQRSTISIVL